MVFFKLIPKFGHFGKEPTTMSLVNQMIDLEYVWISHLAKIWVFEMRFDHYSNVIYDGIGLTLYLVYFVSFEIQFD